MSWYHETMRRVCATLAVIVTAAACGGADTGRHLEPPNTRVPIYSPEIEPDVRPVRLLFGGDVMLGRGVTALARQEGPELFEGVRHVITSADLALANLESPATDAPHVTDNPNDLRFPPDLVALLTGAGFDAMSVANNHSGDAGFAGFEDTLTALDDAGLEAVGMADEPGWAVPIRRDVGGTVISFLAYDLTGLGIEPSPDNRGTAHFHRETAVTQVAEEAAAVDVVVVALHGGVEYLLESDPILAPAAAALVEAGADIVWGHGPHVPQPVISTGRSIIATSLGNFLFDQGRAITEQGLILEVMASPAGLLAYRVGRISHADLRVRFYAWEDPSGDVVLLDGEWWSLLGPPSISAPQTPSTEGFPWGDVTAAGQGDVTGDGITDLVVSYRHAFRSNPVNRLFPESDFTDEAGRSAHVGVFEPGSFEPQWAAGTLLRPIADLAVCDGAMAVTHDQLDAPAIVAVGAWTWHDFGFAMAPELRGVGIPACADVDMDGRLDPVILAR